MNWPIGSGVDFKGVYDREKSRFAFEGKEPPGQHESKRTGRSRTTRPLDHSRRNQYQTLRDDDVELLDGAGYVDLEKVRHGKLSPVFFGSAFDKLRRGAVPEKFCA